MSDRDHPSSKEQLDALINSVYARMPSSVTPSTRIEIHPADWIALTREIERQADEIECLRRELAEVKIENQKIIDRTGYEPGNALLLGAAQARVAHYEAALRKIIAGRDSLTQSNIAHDALYADTSAQPPPAGYEGVCPHDVPVGSWCAGCYDSAAREIAAALPPSADPVAWRKPVEPQYDYTDRYRYREEHGRGAPEGWEPLYASPAQPPGAEDGPSSHAALQGALHRLSQAMGNPAIGWDDRSCIEVALVEEAIRRLAQPPGDDFRERIAPYLRDIHQCLKRAVSDDGFQIAAAIYKAEEAIRLISEPSRATATKCEVQKKSCLHGGPSHCGCFDTGAHPCCDCGAVAAKGELSGE